MDKRSRWAGSIIFRKIGGHWTQFILLEEGCKDSRWKLPRDL